MDKNKTPAKYASKAQIWQTRYTKSAGDQTAMFDKFNEWYKMMYAIRDDKNVAKWRSKIHIPLVSTKAWNMIAKFIQQEPGFEVEVRDEENEGVDLETLRNIAEKVDRSLEMDYHNPELAVPIRDKLNDCLVDAVVTGTGFAKVPWVTKEKKLYRHATKKNGQLDYENDEVVSMLIGHNDLEPVNIFNVFIAPSATSLQTSPWVIIKEFKTLAQLRAVNKGLGIDVYKNLDALKNVRASSDRFAEHKKVRQNLTTEQDVISADETVDLIEIFECYDRDSDKICTYASQGHENGKSDAWLLIRENQNPYWHGKFPLVAFYVRRKPFSFWGESIFETTERLQSAGNDIFNHYMDNWNLAVDGGIMIDETSQVADFVVEPGFELVYRGEQPKQFSFPAPDPNQLTLVINQIEKSLENATISNYATGTPVSGLDKTQGTARGTMAILEAATDMIQFMRDNFNSTLTQIGEMWLSNRRQFTTFETPVPVLKDNKYDIEMLTPEELQLQMLLRVQDMSMKPISEQQDRENFITYTDRLTLLQQGSIAQSQLTGDPNQILFIDWHQEARELAKKFNTRGLEKQIMPNEKALAVQNQAQEQQMAIQQAEQERVNGVDSMVAEISELPDEDRLLQAEQLINELGAIGG